MGGWRRKLILLLVVYFAGFASAIYCVAPVPENQAHRHAEKGFVQSAFESDQFAQSFNCQMHKFLDFAKDTAQRAGELAKEKLAEARSS
jgi:predicted amidophosphoribosyltransferase